MSNKDATLRNFMGYDMKRAFNVIQSDLNATLQPMGLRMVTFSVLTVIRDNPGIRQSQLADILSIERPNLVLILDELEQNGAVKRVRASGDRRAYELSVTDAGQALSDRAIEAVDAHDTRMAEGLDRAEREALHKALRAIELSGGTSNDRRTVSRS